MKKRIFTYISFCILLFVIFLFFNPQAFAQTLSPKPTADYFKAKVTKIIEEGFKKVGNTNNIFQVAEVELLEGPAKNKLTYVEHGGLITITEEQKIQVGEVLILAKNSADEKYTFVDKYRLDTLYYVITAFFIFVVFIAGRKGLGALLGMFISFAIIVFLIIPQIVNGANPLLVSLIGSIAIMVITIYLAHGVSKQTSVAVFSTAVSLSFSVLISIYLVKEMKLSGLGSEDIYSLTQGFMGKIQFQGLLLGSIIIGTLGVLDDVTTTQTATIYELSDANPKFGLKELFQRGMRIGREHIASLVNTLVLAYTGASIGVIIYLIIAVQHQSQPLWLILNSEVIMEEIIRTIAGSASLIFAVPITTLFAAISALYSIKFKDK